jgi:prepilin signal peptidase PulO-like enzyme (type II secretory pathway)
MPIETIMFAIIIITFGLVIGSFLNALIWRLHSGDSMLGRSKCPGCDHQLAWFDNLPLLSYFLLDGRCRHCRQAISWQYPAVEAIMAGLFYLVFLQVGGEAAFYSLLDLLWLFKAWFLIAVMVLIFVYDLRWYLILDKVLAPTAAVLFLFWLAQTGLMHDLLMATNNWLGLFYALLIGGGFFALQYLVSNGKWIGLGDVKLGLVIGMALADPRLVMAALFLAYMLGASVGLVLVAFGKKELGSKLPFGTFLSAATVAVLLWGDYLIITYFQLVSR